MTTRAFRPILACGSPSREARPRPSLRMRLERARAEEGFSFIEVVVAIAIFAVVMIMLSAMLGAGMRGVLLGKQRETAVQEMNRLLEIARSLSYHNVGLASSDPTIAEDPAIVDVGGVKSYLVEAPDNYEPIMWATDTNNHPFKPHTRTFDRGPSTLTSFVYVTGTDANGDGVVDYKRVTVRVAWEARGTPGPENEVRAQTFVSETGSVPINPPGSGGNAVPLTADTNSFIGTAAIRAHKGTLANPLPSGDPGGEPVNIALPRSQGSSRSPVPSSVACTSTGTSIAYGNTTYGGASVSASADDDPTSGAPMGPVEQSDPGFILASGISLIDGVLQLVTTTTLSSPAYCFATAAHADGLPYERGTASGPSSIQLAQDVGGTGLGLTTLPALKIGSSEVEQVIDHELLSGARLVDAQAQGSVGETRVYEIAGVAPRGIVRIAPFSYALRAGAHPADPGEPVLDVPGGIFIEIWDPEQAIASALCDAYTSDKYCQKTVQPGASGFAGWSAAYDGRVANLTTTEIKADISVSAMPPSVKDGVAGPNGETLWEASYTALSVSVRLQISVSVLGVTVKLTDGFVDLVVGQGRATACRGGPCLV